MRIVHFVSMALFIFWGFNPVATAQSPKLESLKPVKVAIVGLVHSHVHWMLEKGSTADYKIVGIAEPDQKLVEYYQAKYELDEALFFESLPEMLKKTQPEGVCVFTTIKDHLQVVEECAPKGIHVMVEKPLAVSLEDARKMESLALEHNIHLLTNYETTWYSSINKASQLLFKQRQIGELNKVTVESGHMGPKEVVQEAAFLEWLCDPEQSGGGALMDFGCYGANLITWLMKNEKPETVTAITQTFRLKDYPNVEDEATIILTYPDMLGIVQASWNWPDHRKRMSLFGSKGYINCLDGQSMQISTQAHPSDAKLPAPRQLRPYDNPFTYFAAVMKEKTEVQATDLSSLPNNMIVMEILDAAQRSAESGQTIRLSNYKIDLD
jgi:predicted dehydrogenase